MGINGFTTFINDRAHLYFEDYELCDCYLIIDGHSISCQLYNWNHWQFHARSNNSYGGDYDKYAYIVENFFGMLKKVRVTPIVIFDGGFEQRKLPTILSRMQDKIKTADQLNPEYEKKHPNKVVFPLFLREAFKDILRHLDIEMVMCQHEGDPEIASIAKLLNCPVLTFDSDYFLFGAQYIPFKTLDSEVRAIENWRTGTYKKWISCKMYRIGKFLEDFEGLQESSLHLLPVLIGNDYIDKKLFNKFLKSINLYTNDSQEKIKGILNWLKNETTESAIKKILLSLKDANEQEIILRKIEKIMSGYYFVESRLLKFLNISFTSEFTHKNFDFTALKEVHKQLIDHDSDSNASPSGAEEVNCSENDSNIKYIEENDKIKNFNIFSPKKPPDTNNHDEQVEDIDSPKNTESDLQSNSNENGISDKDSEKRPANDNKDIPANNSEDEETLSITFEFEDSYLEKENDSENPVSKIFLRNFTRCQYPSSFMDILTQNKYYCIPQVENHAQEHSHDVSLEVLRAIHKILTNNADSDFIVVARGEGSKVKWYPQEKYTVPVPTIEEIEQPPHQGGDILFRILNIDKKFVSLLAQIPTEWHTFIIALKYAESKTAIETPLIYSLLLCFIILNHVDQRFQRIGYYRSPERYKKKYLSFVQINDPVPFRTDKNCFYSFPSEDCIAFMQKVTHFFKMNPRENAQTFDKDLVHQMAQIQSVLLHIQYLNSLLKCPYPNLLIHQIFDGTFIYNLTKVFQKKSSELENY